MGGYYGMVVVVGDLLLSNLCRLSSARFNSTPAEAKNYLYTYIYTYLALSRRRPTPADLDR